ncbi:DUF2061 domain-containing protein [Sanyastnella coralliicola]|uniref:DUF2061 domain-containing protein n=1 Tax=Sanyastnella coralliicola TaxID=3069118 RepID=UPI0027B91371|nr:DUF2061 domain-containing protein [Longitalea sp. SCSIO 12813]
MFLDKTIERSLPENGEARSPWHSFLKTLSWRILGTIDTIVISWLITGTLELALSIGGIEVVSKMILYYFHERVWERFSVRTKKGRSWN